MKATLQYVGLTPLPSVRAIKDSFGNYVKGNNVCVIHVRVHFLSCENGRYKLRFIDVQANYNFHESDSWYKGDNLDLDDRTVWPNNSDASVSD